MIVFFPDSSADLIHPRSLQRASKARQLIPLNTNS
jgi:hypothetical protein